MDYQAEDAGEVTNITPEELQRILDRASAEDVPTLVTALRHTYQVLESHRVALNLYESLIEKLSDIHTHRAEILKVLHDRDYAVWEAVHFIREFRNKEQKAQGAHLANTKSD
jgi:hypothetical protein